MKIKVSVERFSKVFHIKSRIVRANFPDGKGKFEHVSAAPIRLLRHSLKALKKGNLDMRNPRRQLLFPNCEAPTQS